MTHYWNTDPDPTTRIRLVKAAPALWLICPTRWDEKQQRRTFVPVDEARGALASSFTEALGIQSDMLAGRWEW